MSSLSVGQMNQLGDALERAGFTQEDVTALGQNGGGVLDQALAEIRRDGLNFTVRVDRSTKPAYPNWVGEVLHTELERTGPAEYDLLTRVEDWLHDDQRTGAVPGTTIYDCLKTDNALADQLGLADLLAIQAKGIAVFRKLFAGKVVFGWKSVVRGHDGDLDVPFLYEHDDEVVLSWYWLDRGWSSSNPALRFRKPARNATA